MSKEPLLPEEENSSSIFSTPKSRQEIKEEAKAQQKAEKEARKQALKEHKARRAKHAAESDPDRRTMIWTLVIILGVIVVAIALILVSQLRGNGKDEADDSGHFYDTATYPEMSTDGIKGAITEAYYTKDGSLCVKLRFSNGVDAEHYVTSLEVKVSNEDEEIIATGYTKNIPDDYYVPAEDYSTFTFYITKEFVKITDDDLDQISYEITVHGEVDSDALAAATTTADSNATTGSTTASTTAATTVA